MIAIIEKIIFMFEQIAKFYLYLLKRLELEDIYVINMICYI